MASTIPHALTATAWTKVSNGEARVFIQRKSSEYIRVHVGQSAPALGTGAFFVLADDGGGSASLNELAPTDFVYLRGMADKADAVVVLG